MALRVLPESALLALFFFFKDVHSQCDVTACIHAVWKQRYLFHAAHYLEFLLSYDI